MSTSPDAQPPTAYSADEPGPLAMKLVVTGGSGYIGAEILRRAPQNWETAATCWAHPIGRAHVTSWRVDMRDADAVDRLLEEFRPNAVIHTAALMAGAEMAAVNVQGSRNVARAAARTRTRLIHLSSDVIFDGEHAPYDESALPSPMTPYAVTKTEAEKAVQEVYPHPVIVRTSLVYGFSPMDPRTRQVLEGGMPRLFTDEYRCPIFVSDLADALLELATLDYTGILNIAGPQRLSRYEFGLKLASALGAETKFQPSSSAAYAAPRPRDCSLDVALAQRIFKTTLRSVDEVLQKLASK